jgi:hypothetical protein
MVIDDRDLMFAFPRVCLWDGPMSAAFCSHDTESAVAAKPGT